MLGIILIIILDAVLLFFLFRKNKKYPFGGLDYLLVVVTALIACFLSAYLNTLNEDILLYVMKDKFINVENGRIWDSTGDVIFFYFIHFLGVAIVEEAAKHIILFIQIRKKTVRTYLDCVLSFILVSAIFSVTEDIVYYINYGSSVGIPRLVTELAGHIMFSMIVGECYYKYLINKKILFMHRYLQERGNVKSNIVIKKKTISIFVKGFALAIFLHFMYNFVSVVFKDAVDIILYITYTTIFIIKYIKSLKNPLIFTTVAEKYEKLQFDIKKEEIYSIFYVDGKTK